MHVKEQLLFLRKVGFTEKAIANAIQAHQSTVSRILSGQIKDPRGSLIVEINQLFEIEKNKQGLLCSASM
ncbi:MAG: hypothetical protein JSS07_11365 [Proteobacteria bacterium]|nr:hypothetical protein [Pseudomonadota bacterium]